jgi:hypothetical protein
MIIIIIISSTGILISHIINQCLWLRVTINWRYVTSWTADLPSADRQNILECILTSLFKYYVTTNDRYRPLKRIWKCCVYPMTAHSVPEKLRDVNRPECVVFRADFGLCVAYINLNEVLPLDWDYLNERHILGHWHVLLLSVPLHCSSQ